MKKFLYPFLLIVISLVFFYQTFLRGLLPIPADDIVGLYHPFRDLYAQNYPNGIPFKNSLITDPVRQQYPWRKLISDAEKKLEIPLWNPYSMAGTPLLANFQSSAFYPLNFLILFLPFKVGWTVLIISQTLLAGIFMFFYLRNQKLRDEASILGSLAFAFCGFSIAWLEWGTVISTALWTPLVLLSIDKLFENNKRWIVGLILGLSFSFFAGHLQIFFYGLVLYLFYVIFLKRGKTVRYFPYVFIGILISAALVLPQAIPTLQFISESARNIDLNWQNPGWFIPIQHLVQFLVPDFFGNPSTINYFGTWNYGEMVGYVGIFPLIMAVLAVFSRERKVVFFWLVIVISLIFASSNFISQIPYQLKLPFLATSQPTRLIYLIDVSLSICAAFGINYFIRNKPKKNSFIVFVIFSMLFVMIGAIIFTNPGLDVSKRNFYLPISFFIGSILVSTAYLFVSSKNLVKILPLVLIPFVAFDLFRFGWKFTPFTNSSYIFPQTKILTYLQNQKDKNFRIMSLDSEILPPNFSIAYKIQDVSGYDPLYLLSYGQFISAMERGRPDISPPFGFNRLITPKNYSSKLFNLLNVKYLLTFSKLDSPHFKLILSEGKTNLYENTRVLPRTFFVENTINSNSDNNSVKLIYNSNFDPLKSAAVERFKNETFIKGNVLIDNYTENEIKVSTENTGDGFLVFLDTYYPSWKAYVDGNPADLYKTDYNFRGVLVPAGKHKVIFKDNLLW